jgi:hypothetical protein
MFADTREVCEAFGGWNDVVDKALPHQGCLALQCSARSNPRRKTAQNPGIMKIIASRSGPHSEIQIDPFELGQEAL